MATIRISTQVTALNRDLAPTGWLKWLGRFGTACQIGIDGTGSYGATGAGTWHPLASGSSRWTALIAPVVALWRVRSDRDSPLITVRAARHRYVSLTPAASCRLITTLTDHRRHPAVAMVRLAREPPADSRWQA
jgi:hypothetical protein